MQQSYDIAVVGPSGVGKTAWLRRLLTGEFERQHWPTTAVEVRPLSIATNRGSVTVRFHDCPGGQMPSSSDLRAWVVVVSKEAMGELAAVRQAVAHASPAAHVVIVINRCDQWGCDALSADDDAALRSAMVAGDMAYPISAKNNYQFEKPVLDLLRRLRGDADLCFVEEAPITPAGVRLP